MIIIFHHVQAIQHFYCASCTRLIQIHKRDFFNPFPSGHFNYKISEANAIQISYSRRVNRPRFWDLNPFFTFSNPRNFFSGNPNVNPEYTDAIYNIGAIYFLQGNPLVEKMNTLTTSPADTKIYNSLVEERKAIYRKAKTYFERVLEIKPDDANALATVKKIDRVLNR